MLRVEVMTDDKHLFEVEIDSVLEVPELGTSITCGVCKKQRKVTKVGVPYRSGEGKPPSTDPDQKSILGGR